MIKPKINTEASEFKIIENKKDEPQYKEVSKFVGGMVECVQFPNGDLLLVNEEGKLMQNGLTGAESLLQVPVISV